MENKEYKNYFKNHYKYSFSEKDLEDHKQRFQVQFNIISKKLSNNFSGKRILEIWSATWSFYQFLEKYDCEYIWIEIDQSAVDWANNRFWNKFICSSIEDFDWSWYDYIFAFEVLEHIHSPLEAISKINKILKPWWKFIWTSPFPFYKNIYADKTHKFCLHPNNWKKLFDDEWFTTKTEAFSFIPYLRRLSEKLNFRIPFYIWLRYFISTTLIVAQKK